MELFAGVTVMSGYFSKENKIARHNAAKKHEDAVYNAATQRSKDMIKKAFEGEPYQPRDTLSRTPVAKPEIDYLPRGVLPTGNGPIDNFKPAGEIDDSKYWNERVAEWIIIAFTLATAVGIFDVFQKLGFGAASSIGAALFACAGVGYIFSRLGKNEAVLDGLGIVRRGLVIVLFYALGVFVLYEIGGALIEKLFRS